MAIFEFGIVNNRDISNPDHALSIQNLKSHGFYTYGAASGSFGSLLVNGGSIYTMTSIHPLNETNFLVGGFGGSGTATITGVGSRVKVIGIGDGLGARTVVQNSSFTISNGGTLSVIDLVGAANTGLNNSERFTATSSNIEILNGTVLIRGTGAQFDIRNGTTINVTNNSFVSVDSITGGSDDTAIFGVGSNTSALSIMTVNASDIDVDSTGNSTSLLVVGHNSGNGILSLNNGSTLDVTGAVNASVSVEIGRDVGSIGNLNLIASGLTVTTVNGLQSVNIGWLGGMGTLSLQNGASVNMTTTGASFSLVSVGEGAGSVGFISVLNSTFTVNNSVGQTFLNVGLSGGTGTLNLYGSTMSLTATSFGNLNIGRDFGSGIVTLTDSSVLEFNSGAGGFFNIGRNGGTGTLNIDNSIFRINGTGATSETGGSIGRSGAGAEGTVNVTNGGLFEITASANNAFINIARSSNSTAIVSVTDSTFAVKTTGSGDTSFVNIGRGGTGVLIADNSTLDFTSTTGLSLLRIGRSGGEGALLVKNGSTANLVGDTVSIQVGTAGSTGLLQVLSGSLVDLNASSGGSTAAEFFVGNASGVAGAVAIISGAGSRLQGADVTNVGFASSGPGTPTNSVLQIVDDGMLISDSVFVNAGGSIVMRDGLINASAGTGVQFSNAVFVVQGDAGGTSQIQGGLSLGSNTIVSFELNDMRLNNPVLSLNGGNLNIDGTVVIGLNIGQKQLFAGDDIILFDHQNQGTVANTFNLNNFLVIGASASFGYGLFMRDDRLLFQVANNSNGTGEALLDLSEGGASSSSFSYDTTSESGSGNTNAFSAVSGVNLSSVQGTSGVDVLSATGTGNFNLLGAGGNDSLTGNDGINLLIGGRGNDTLAGGGGIDDFIFYGDFGSDIVTDAEAGETLRFLDRELGDLILTEQGNDVLITELASSNSVLVKNVSLPDITVKGKSGGGSSNDGFGLPGDGLGFLGTNVSVEAVQTAGLLATRDLTDIANAGFRHVRPSELGLTGDAGDDFFPYSANGTVGLYVFEDLNNLGEFALVFTPISLAQVPAVFPTILPTPPNFNTDYADDFSAVYAKLQVDFTIHSILTTGFSLGGVATNQLSQSFANHFGTIDSTFVSFGSELLYEAENLINLGASNDTLFGSYNDYAALFVPGDPGLSTFANFSDAILATSGQAGAVNSASFLVDFFTAEPRDLTEDGTLNWYIDIGPIGGSPTFTIDQLQFFSAPHNLSRLNYAVNTILNSGYADQITLDSRVVFDLSASEVSAVRAGNPFLTIPSNEPVFVLGEEPVGSVFDGNDILTGHSGIDVIVGFGGNDIIAGLAGDDTLDGGEGNDTASYATATGGVNVNLATGTTTGADGTDTLISIENIIGSTLGDTLTGNTDANVINGGLGNDTLNGGDGNDVLTGGFNQDTLNGGDGDDDLDGGAGSDIIDGGAGIDTGRYDSFGGAIIINLNLTTAQNTGAAGTETISNVENLIGGVGNDRFTGKVGVSVLEGGGGSDSLFGLGGDDVLNGGSGNDNAQGGNGADMLIGGDGRDTLVGGGGIDTIQGDDGKDVIRGGDDEDIINGGAGRDVLIGGDFTGGGFPGDAAADTFVFSDVSHSSFGGATRDIIRDFEQTLDIIDLSAIDAITGGGNDAFTFIGTSGFSGSAGELRAFSIGGNTTVRADVDGDGAADLEIFLNGTIAMTTGDFVL